MAILQPFSAGILLYMLAILWYRRYRANSFPPGPTGLPLIGIALHLRRTQLWQVFSDWANTYGDVMHFSVLGHPIIVLNSRAAVVDLLERRNALYSDRPRSIFAGEMVGYAEFTIMSRYGRRLKNSRKIISSLLTPQIWPEINAIQEEQAIRFILRLGETPESIGEHIRWFVMSVIWKITHGYDLIDIQDPLAQVVESVNEEFSNLASPGSLYLVELFPCLCRLPDWMPGTNFKRTARRARENLMRSRDEPYEMVKEQMISGTAPPSLTRTLIEQNPHATSEQEDVQRMTTSHLQAAGWETSISSIESLFFMVGLFPHIQERAQLELESVIGTERLPCVRDRKRLPYIEGLLKELYRWKPIGPLGMPHSVMQEDEYMGYKIPKGATVVANTWAILHDPQLYPNPHEPLPERYTTNSEDDSHATACDNDINPDPRAFAFGYGRRACPGKLLADDMLFIVIAMLLTAFNISDVKNAEGLPMEKSTEYVGNLICHPPAFSCNIVWRSENVKSLVQASI